MPPLDFNKINELLNDCVTEHVGILLLGSFFFSILFVSITAWQDRRFAQEIYRDSRNGGPLHTIKLKWRGFEIIPTFPPQQPALLDLRYQLINELYLFISSFKVKDKEGTKTTDFMESLSVFVSLGIDNPNQANLDCIRAAMEVVAAREGENRPKNPQEAGRALRDLVNQDLQSPLDQFSIVPFLPLRIGKLYFSFTNPSFFLLLTLSFVLFFFHLVTKKGGGKLVPNAWQSLVELIYDFVPNLVNEQIGGLSGNVKQKFFPCISVTFTFLLFRNLQGMIPYSFTVTSHFIVTLGLSFSLFIGITIVGFAKNGLHFLSFSLPAGVPLPLAPFLVLLELIPHCFRALSLGIRLFANMMAGHSLVKILSGFAWTMLCMNDLFYFIGSTGPFFIVLALTGLELGVAILQAYVFTILICIYLNDAINLH